jgi:hypothetical protein
VVQAIQNETEEQEEQLYKQATHVDELESE